MKVSVCMITYNHEKYVAQAIESVLMQETDFDYELVIGEDCSTDRTREIVLEYEKKYPDKIRLLLPERNLGMMKNFVTTLQACRGEYVALLEGDDYWTDQYKLKKQVDFLSDDTSFAICFHDVLIETSNGLLPKSRFYASIKDSYTLEDLCEANFISTPSCLFRNKLIPSFPDWYYKSPVGDWVLHMMNAQYGKIKYINSIMAVYRIHDSGSWESKGEEYKLWQTLKLYRLLIAVFKGNIQSLLRQNYALRRYKYALQLYDKGKIMKARINVLIAIRYGFLKFWNKDQKYWVGRIVLGNKTLKMLQRYSCAHA